MARYFKSIPKRWNLQQNAELVYCHILIKEGKKKKKHVRPRAKNHSVYIQLLHPTLEFTSNCGIICFCCHSWKLYMILRAFISKFGEIGHTIPACNINILSDLDSPSCVCIMVHIIILLLYQQPNVRYQQKKTHHSPISNSLLSFLWRILLQPVHIQSSRRNARTKHRKKKQDLVMLHLVINWITVAMLIDHRDS